MTKSSNRALIDFAIWLHKNSVQLAGCHVTIDAGPEMENEDMASVFIEFEMKNGKKDSYRMLLNRRHLEALPPIIEVFSTSAL